MVEWLAYWPAILAGAVFGPLFSLVREFSRRLVFSAVLFFITYKALVNALALAGAQWDYQLAGSAMLGIFLGCLMRPASAGIVRKIRSMTHSRRES